MTLEIGLTLGIVAATVVLFATEKLRVDLIALIVLLTVALTGLVDTKQAFAGFSSPAVITVWAVYIVSGGLFATGVADLMGRAILRLAGDSEVRLIVVIMLSCGVMSAFMNNVGATAMLLPAVIGISRRSNVPVSRLLIPLSFSSLMGGNMTLIGTPANILASNILIDRGLPSFGFFDFLPTGLTVFAVGVVYMALLGRKLLPVRETPGGVGTSARRLREYLSEVKVQEDSFLAGKTLQEAALGDRYDLTVVSMNRAGHLRTNLYRNSRIQAGDLLFIRGSVDNLLRARQELGIRVEAELEDDLAPMEGKEVAIVEATLAPNTHLVGKSLRQIFFRDRYGFNVLAIWRRGEVITKRLRSVKLQFGDALLLLGPAHRADSLEEGDEFLLLEPRQVKPSRTGKAPFAVATMLLVLGLAMFAGLSIATAMLTGAVLMVLGGCLSMEEAYQSIEWKTVFLVAGMLPLGTAMEVTGTARFVSDILLGAAGGWGPVAVLAGIYILSALITQPMSNAAAVVLMVPIAIDAAVSLGANIEPFVLATVIGASTSFLTPVGHKANVLVFGPGGYRFFDYTRVGAPLNLVTLIVTLITLPLIWPIF